MDGEVETKFSLQEDRERLPCLPVNCDALWQPLAKLGSRKGQRHRGNQENCFDKFWGGKWYAWIGFGERRVMQAYLPVRGPRALHYSLSLLLAAGQTLFAAGVVTNNTDADLRGALAGGGTVTFATDGTIVLTNTISITNSTVIDGTGRSVVISGGSTIRLFEVQSNVSFFLVNLTLADGLAFGTNGGTSMDGGPGEGGAIYNDGGTVSALTCGFLRNSAQGGQGGTAAFGS